MKTTKFEKLNLDKFKNQKLSDISTLFGGDAYWCITVSTKPCDRSDTGYQDPPVLDPA